MPIYQDLPYIGPPRWYGNYQTRKKLIVVHCTSNTASARGEAGYATRRSDSVSSHYYVDDDEIVQSLNTDLVAYHGGNAPSNTGGISYEFTGHVNWSRSYWLADSDDIHGGARQMARDCRHWGIPPRWLTVEQLRAGWAGLTTHDDVRRAWGGTHTDPGPGFPRDVLLREVQRVLNGDDVSAKDVWQTDGIVPAPRVDGLGRPVELDGDGNPRGNPYWWGGNMVRNNFELTAKARGEQLAQHEALMAALQAHSDMPGADFEQIKAAAKAGAGEALAAADIAVTWGPRGE